MSDSALTDTAPALLVGVDFGEPHFDGELQELGLLAETAGMRPVARLTCKRRAPDAALFVGSGKRIKESSGPLAPSEAGGCSATESTGPSRIAEQPAVCWKMQFHWYDGQQDRVRNSS